MARVSATADLEALADCDLVLESVVEDLDVKKQLFVELDRIVKDGAILATNTSTLPVVEMAVETGRPERVVGVHFFNPAPAMSLVEVVRTLLSSDETVAEAVAFAEACGKAPVVVEGPRRLHRRTRCCSRTSTTPCACSRTAPPAATTSTRP